MPSLRPLLPILGALLLSGNAAAASANLPSDSLQQVLSHTSDPKTRIGLLLNLKDLNEETDLNVPLSIQLFREATDIGDTYAMGIALIPILNRYATYPEKDDSMHFYIRNLRRLAPETRQEGMDIYAEMHIAISRLRGEYDFRQQKEIAKQILEWCQTSSPSQENLYNHIRQHILLGYADIYMNAPTVSARNFTPHIDQWQTTLNLIRQISSPSVRYSFMAALYPILGYAYIQAGDYPAQVRLGDEYIRLLDEYIAYERQTGRRPYLYADNAYVSPYRHLIQGAYTLGDISNAEFHYQQFRRRMLAASGKNLLRNKSYLFEVGCNWQEISGNYDRSLLFCDSLIRLIEQGHGYFQLDSRKIIGAHHTRSRLLSRMGRDKDAYDAYARTYTVTDSLDRTERTERLQAIRRRNDMNQRQLAETRAAIRNHATALISAACILLLLTAAGVYFYRGLRRNRRLQGGIVRMTRKAQESERMKSNFLNSICNDLRTPFHAVDQAAWRLMVSEMSSEERAVHIDAIRKNTAQLLSTLDNMLEAASLGSLTEGLRFEQTDIHALCRAELCHTEQKHPDRGIEYRFESSEKNCVLRTHGRYLSHVVRAMLDNAAKFTTQGYILLRCDMNTRENTVSISVSDTGPGIPPDIRECIFNAGPQSPAAGHGQSLALCALIALHMQGSIRIDETYSSGARIIFSIPLNT